MQYWLKAALVAVALSWAGVTFARAEMLAMVVYETKAEDSIRELQLQGTRPYREDGVAIIDVDPASERYGQVLMRFPLPQEWVPHHQFYNIDKTKIYVTTEVQDGLHIFDLTRVPYRVTRLRTPDCTRTDGMVFSGDGKTWWLTCMGSHKVLIGDAVADRVVGEIAVPKAGPHGIALDERIDRILVTNSLVAPEPLTLGESITVIEASSGAVLSSHRLAELPSPAGTNPVDILFVPGSRPPLAYINAMFDGANKKGVLWAALWDAKAREFQFHPLFNFATTEGSMPAAMTLSFEQDRLFVSTGHPGHFHIFDIADNKLKPKLLKTLPAAAGAHHAALSPDGRYAFIQNGILNFPGLNDGSITVIDLETMDVFDNITTFKDAGYAGNHILMLPEWHRAPGE